MSDSLGMEVEPGLFRLLTGDPQLDLILGVGNSINILMGEPGSGKTVLAEAMVFANASDDRPILYFTTLSEPLDKVVRYLQGFDFFDEAKLAGSVIYDSIGSEVAENGVAAVVPRLKDAILTHHPKIIVIDLVQGDSRSRGLDRGDASDAVRDGGTTDGLRDDSVSGRGITADQIASFRYQANPRFVPGVELTIYRNRRTFGLDWRHIRLFTDLLSPAGYLVRVANVRSSLDGWSSISTTTAPTSWSSRWAIVSERAHAE